MWLSRRISAPLRGAALLAFVLLVTFTQADSKKRNPVSYVTEIEDPRIRTPQSRAHALSEFDLIFSIHGGDQDVKLTLKPNLDLIPDAGAKIEIANEAGEIVETRTLRRDGHRVYKGHSWLRDENGWYNVGWSRIVLLRDGARPQFEGVFSIFHDTHHVQLRNTYTRTKHAMDPDVKSDGDDFMVVWKESDIVKDGDGDIGGGELRKRGWHDGQICSADNLTFNSNPDHPLNARFMEPMPRSLWGIDLFEGSLYRRGITRRQNLDEGNYYGGGISVVSNPLLTIGSTDGCPRTKMVALIGVVTDCTYTADFDNEDQVQRNIITNLNTASALYEKSFNIALALGSLVILPATCPGTAPETAKWNLPCRDSVDIHRRLDLISEWRGKKGNDGLALWMLMTTCETGPSVGLAWLGQVCRYATSTNKDGKISSTGALVVARTSQEWKVMAHEIGHMFGANHDCVADNCPNGNYDGKCCPMSRSQCNASGKYMMNPSTGEQITDFSPCTIGALCSSIKNKQIDTTCLTSNKGVKSYTEAKCGNGIVEPGEDCDCGGEENCNNNLCCDAKTCKYTEGSVCDDSNEECCDNCQFASSARICRPSNGECDPEESCTGTSSICPKDEVKPDGSDCSNGLQCASGQCTSRDLQCKTSGITSLGDYSSNDTTACNNDDCMIGCKSPKVPNMCIYNSQSFLDGTICKGDGKCRSGKCVGYSTGGQILAWIRSHKSLVIGIAVAVGVLLLLAITSCIWSRCRGRRRVPVKEVPASRNPHWQPIPSTDGVSAYPMPPPPMRHGSSVTSAGGRRPPPPPPERSQEPPLAAYYNGNSYPAASRWG
ncbi:hypothetical protein EX30DRAFT_327979 [Ascodesmis nigricans]|uniref:Disintegrin and metalloproteinase domain-containing protein B n=1 Tax=Ascodesmis nigricans TaxID=341454 RepID=A0A4S2N4H5_9PEZI|nr:hypothetical protein EX30DRAFT_327979 [Ascodesmis nigricans]